MSCFLVPSSFTERVLSEISEKPIYPGLLEKLAISQGYDKNFVDIWYPQGMASFLKDYSISCNNQLAILLHTEECRMMRMHERVAFAVQNRILIENIPHENLAASIFIYMTSPLNFIRGLSYYTHIVDNIWYEVGDTSTDWNYYSKRALLLGVYMSTLGFWIGDTSVNHEDSWKFMQNRLYDVMRLGRLRKKIGASFPTFRLFS